MTIRMSDEMRAAVDTKQLRDTALVYALQYMSGNDGEYRDHRGAASVVAVAKVFEEYLK